MRIKTVDIEKEINHKDHIIFTPTKKVFIAYNKKTKSVVHNENSKTRVSLIDLLDGFSINESMIDHIESWLDTYVYRKISNSTPLGLEDFKNDAIQVLDSILTGKFNVIDEFDFTEIECSEKDDKDAIDEMLNNELVEIFSAINVIAKSIVKITDYILKGDL